MNLRSAACTVPKVRPPVGTHCTVTPSQLKDPAFTAGALLAIVDKILEKEGSTLIAKAAVHNHPLGKVGAVGKPEARLHVLKG